MRPDSFPPFLLLLLVSSPILLISSNAADTPTAYEELLDYDFPVGLLPQGVTGYELHKNTGEFKVFMKDSCSFKIQAYDIKYRSTISGVIQKGRLKNLKGINVKILVVWLNIVEVSRHGDLIDFSVGIASTGFEKHRLLGSVPSLTQAATSLVRIAKAARSLVTSTSLVLDSMRMLYAIYP